MFKDLTNWKKLYLVSGRRLLGWQLVLIFYEVTDSVRSWVSAEETTAAEFPVHEIWKAEPSSCALASV